MSASPAVLAWSCPRSRFGAAALSLLIVLAAALAASGCECDTTSPPDGAVADGAVPDGALPDAALPDGAVPMDPNSPPEITSSPPTTAVEGQAYEYSVTSTDPDGDPVQLELVDPPAEMQIDAASGTLRWIPPYDSAGSQPVELVASDGRLEASQSWTIEVADANRAPVFLSEPPLVGRPGSRLTYAVEADDADGDTITLRVASGPSGMAFNGASLEWPSPVAGAHAVVLEADDGTDRTEQRFTIGIGNGGAGPSVRIDTPSDGSTVRVSTDVVGTVSDPSLVGWRLEVRRASDGLHVAYAGRGDMNVSGGRLGLFDASLLPNGIYELELSAGNAGGGLATTSVSLTVEGEAKVGQLRLEYVDLQIDNGEMRIEVRRIYDSSDPTDGDFGRSWRLEMSQFGVEEDGVQGGAGWRVEGNILGRTVTGPFDRFVVPRVPGPPEAFVFVPEYRASGFGYDELTHRYEATQGTGSTLSCVGSSCPQFIYYLNDGRDELRGSFGSGPIFDPDRYAMTTADGLSYEMSEANGLEAVVDPFGRRLSISRGSIVGPGGDRIDITRSGGRVTEVRDGAGRSVAYEYDASGMLGRVTLADATGEQYTYFARRLSRIDDLTGRLRTRYEYQADGRVAVEVGPSGDRVERSYDLTGRRVMVREPTGGTRELGYDEDGNVVFERTPGGGETTRSYSGRDLTAETDAMGRTRSWTHGPRGLVTRERDSRGRDITTAWGALDRITSEGSPEGAGWTYAYDARGAVTSATVAGAGTYTLTPGPFGYASQMQDPEGCSTSYAYDGSARPTSVTTADTDPFIAEYDAAGRIVAQGRPGALSRSTLDAAGRVLTETDPTGRMTTYEHDAAGRLTSVTDPGGGVTRFTYDAAGRVIARELPSGATERTGYGPGNVVSSMVDSAGRVTLFHRDSSGRTTRVVRADGSTEELEYALDDQPSARIDARGQRWEMDRDEHGRVTETRRPGGGRERWTWPTETGWADAPDGGEWLTYLDALDRMTSRTYGPMGGLVREDYPGGASVTLERNGRGELSAIVDEEGRRTTFERSCAGVLTAVEAPGGMRVASTLDGAGRPTRIDNAEGRAITLAYDAADRLTSIELPTSATRTLSYDAGGRLERVVDFDGTTHVFTRDAAGRVTSEAHGALTIETSYRGDDQPWRIVDGTGMTLLSYDARGRLRDVAHPSGARVTIARDAAGAPTRVAAGGTGYDTTYDLEGRVASVVDPAGGTSTLVHDVAGRLLAVASPNGVTTAYGYDDRDRVTSVDVEAGGARLARFDYAYDRSGRLLTRTEDDGSSVAFAYDEAGQITGETRTGTDPYAITYRYDRAGNRVERTIDGVTTTYTIDAGERISGGTSSAGAFSTAWDDAGRLTALTTPAGGRTFAYDGRGRLTRVERDGVPVDVRYDALGQLAAVGSTSMVMDASGGMPRLVRVGTSDGYAHAGALPLVAVEGGAARHLHVGPGGTVLLETDASGAVVSRPRDDAFGARAPPGAMGHGLHGALYLPELGLYWMAERFYDPELGRFLTPDPVAPSVQEPQRLNPYTFSANAPSYLSDPLGTEFSISGLMTSISIRVQMYATYAATAGAAGYQAASRLLMRLNFNMTVRWWQLARMNVGGPRAWYHAIRQFASNIRIFRGLNGPIGSQAQNYTNQFYRHITLRDPVFVYRYWGGSAGETGGYMSTQFLRNPDQIRRLLALRPEWGNTITNVTVYRLPASSQIYYGTAASQGGSYTGGGTQLLIHNWQNMSEAQRLAWKVGQYVMGGG